MEKCTEGPNKSYRRRLQRFNGHAWLRQVDKQREVDASTFNLTIRLALGFALLAHTTAVASFQSAIKWHFNFKRRHQSLSIYRFSISQM